MLDDSHHRGTARASTSRVIESDAAEFFIRPLASHEDYRQCAVLQREVWGPAYGEAVPPSLLQVATYVGGVAAGAFTADGTLLGLVFGLTGVRNGEVVHWSHVLGVRAAARNSGVGRMLKEYQRAELARRGIAKMYWTFDPLIAKNAHVNLNRLGARVVEYVRDMYGTTESPLHHGLATDRLVVVWDTAPGAARDAPAPAAAGSRVPILSADPQAGDVSLLKAERPPAVWIEVPTDMQQLVASSPAAAAAWHASVRTHFEWALRSGYAVAGLHRDPVASRSFYVLTLVLARETGSSAP